MESKFRINIAKDFSPVPIGRYPSDSDSNGADFREKVLVPALAAHQMLEITLDGTEGYGSSFLEEAFGGLVRIHKFSAEEITKRINFISIEDPTLVEEILSYVTSSTSK